MKRALFSVLLLLLSTVSASAASMISLLPEGRNSYFFFGSGDNLFAATRLNRTGYGLAIFKVEKNFGAKLVGTWGYSTDASLGDQVRDIIPTSDNGFAVLIEVAGYKSIGSGSKREGSVWLIKLDADAREEWKQLYSDSSGEMAFQPWGLAQTPDNGYVIAGEAMSDGLKVCKGLVIRTDSRGNLKWKVYLSGRSKATFTHVIPTADNGFFLYGYDNIQNAANYWLVKINATGKLSWQKFYTGYGDELDNPIIHTGGKYFYAIMKATKKTPQLLRISRDSGSIISLKTISGLKSVDMPFNHVVLSDTQFVLCGYSENQTDDILLCKVNSNGTVSWRKTFDNDGNDYSSIVRQTADGGYLLAAQTATTVYTWKLMLLRTDSNGNTKWKEPFYFGEKFCYLLDIHVQSDGRAVLLTESYFKSSFHAVLIQTEHDGRLGTLDLNSMVSYKGSKVDTVPSRTLFKVGDRVMVKWKDKWYKATVLKVRSSKYYIHYDNYGSKWDSWVDRDSVRKR